MVSSVVASADFAEDVGPTTRMSGMTEFQVNTYTTGEQTIPRVAKISGGGSVAVWQSHGQTVPERLGVFAQRYNPDGTPLGNEINVGIGVGVPGGHYGAPSVDGLADGGFVVIWQSYGDNPQRIYLYAQMFSVTGEPRFERWIHVTSKGLFSDACPAEVAGFNQGGFVAVWCAEFVSNSGMVAMRYTQQGKSLGNYRVFAGSNVYDKKPSISVFSDDRFIVTWTDFDQTGNSVFGEIFSGYYSVVPEFKLTTASTGVQMFASVAVLPNDDFISVWASITASSFDIFARRFNSDGVAIGDEWQVNEYVVSTQTKPQVTSLPLPFEKYVIAWESFGQDGQESAIIVREYNSSTNQAISSEFIANTLAVGSQTDVHIASHSEVSDQYFIIWSDSVNDGSGSGIFGVILGTVVDPPTQSTPIREFQINAYSTSYQRTPEVCTLLNGGVVVVWESKGLGGVGSDVYAQIYTPEGEKQGSEIIMDTQSFHHYSPTVDSLGDGGFIVVFLTRESLYDRTHFQRFTAAGVRVGGDSTDGESSGGLPVVAAFPSGGFVIAMPGQSSLSIIVRVQRFSSAGSAVGPKSYPLSSREVQSIGVRIQMLLSETYLLTWSAEDFDQTGVIAVWGQLFSAGGTEIGSKFTLSATTTEQQITPDAAALTSGGFVAVWAAMDPTSGNYDIYGRRFSSNGTPLESENRKLNIRTANHQLNPRVVSLHNGDYFVCWESWSADDHYKGVVAVQFAGVDNKAVTDEIILNTNTQWNQQHVSLTRIGRDRVFATWTDIKLDGDSLGVFGQIIEVAASPTSEEVVVNTGTTSTQNYPAVSNLTSGGAVICWHSFGYDGSSYGIFGQRYNTFGTREGEEFQVNSETIGNQLQPAVSGLPNGGFVVVWQSQAAGDSKDIHGRVFSASGQPAGTQFQVNTITNSRSTTLPDVCSLSDGFVIVWDGHTDGTTFVYIQRYSISGSKIGDEIIIQTNLPRFTVASLPKISCFKNDEFVVSYSDVDVSGQGVVAQIFSSDGQPKSAAVAVNVITLSTQFNSDVAVLSDGTFVVVWASYNWEIKNSKHDIYSRRFSTLGVPLDVDDVRLNDHYDGFQNYPRVAALRSGGYVVSWDSWGADGHYYGVSLKELSASGAAVSSEVIANTANTVGHQYHSEVASFGGYGFVITWNDPALDGDRGGIVARFYTKTFLQEF